MICGAICQRISRSIRAARTSRTREYSKERRPPCPRLVDQDDVPLAKSFISHRKTELPRPAASRAMPQPLMPPPMIARSKIRSKDASPGVRQFTLAILLSIWNKSQPNVKASKKGRSKDVNAEHKAGHDEHLWRRAPPVITAKPLRRG